MLTENTIRETARTAATKYFNEVLGGRDQYACGFAWVTVYPKHKGNTKLGRAERAELTKLGFSQDYNRTYQMWNPSRMACQNVDTLYAGAHAAAAVMKANGYDASAGSRLD